MGETRLDSETTRKAEVDGRAGLREHCLGGVAAGLAGKADSILVLCQSDVAAPSGRRQVVAAFARPVAALARLVGAGQPGRDGFALDVYETAMVRHRNP